MMKWKFALMGGVAAFALTACDQAADTAATPSEEAAVAEPASEAPRLSSADVDAARAAFDALVEDITNGLFRTSPEFATYLGLPEELMGGPYLGRLDDYSLAGRGLARAESVDVIARLSAVDPAPLDDQRRMTRAVIMELVQSGVNADMAADGWGSPTLGGFTIYPVVQLSGLHIDVPNLMQAQQPVTDGAQAQMYVERISALAVAIDDSIAVIEADAAAGVIPPDFVLEKTLGVITRFTEVAATENVLYTALAGKLDEAGIDGGEAYLAAAEAVVTDEVYPAYGRLAAALEVLQADAVHYAGIDRLPNGAAVYNALIRLNADSELSADEIHNIGLAEVTRITSEMDAILQAEGYAEGSVGDRMSALALEERFLYPNTDEGKAELIADLNEQVAEVQALAPEWFGAIPPQAVTVARVPAFSEESAPGGYYDMPSLDGERPGTYWINLRDTANNPSFSLKTLTYHEAVPGHHYQIALSLSLEGVPLLRKLLARTNAYTEGWALYAEQVAEEMGLYEGDPYGNLGRLQSELFRSVRLVVDTGLHAKGWSRERAIDYMVSTGAAEESDATIEIERYAVWPAQALGYKMGMITIGELRARAESQLGEAFDIREFHDVVLLDGGLPLPVLAQRVDGWIAGKLAE